MRRIVPVWLAVAVPALATTAAAQTRPAYAAAGVPATYAATILRAEQFLRDSMAAGGIPGVEITVALGDTILWSTGLGWADVEQQVPVTTLTRMRIGSVSKSLTSAALGILVQEHRLDLDTPVQHYVPSFPVKRWPVTTRELAGHLAGIRHYAGDEFLMQRHFGSVTEGLAVFRDDSLLFAPGTRFAYSSYGFNLVSAAIEGAAGEPFLALMRARVFEPAGMTHTVAEFVDSIIPFRARFYTRTPAMGPVPAGGVVNAPFVDNSYKWAGGGFLSTTEDLVRFGQAMLRGSLVAPASLRLLWTSQRTADGKDTGYGMGWFTDHDAAGRLRVFHAGGSVGGTAYLLIYPDQRLVISVLANADGRLTGRAPLLAEMFLNTASRR